MAKGLGEIMAAGYAFMQPAPTGKLHCPLCGSEMQFDPMGGWFCYGKDPSREHPHCEKRDYFNEIYGDPEAVQGVVFCNYIRDGVKIAECYAVRNRGAYWHVKIDRAEYEWGKERELPQEVTGGEWVMAGSGVV